MKKGKVYLVGSGAGDEKLLTLRAKELIENADVVVYDKIVNPSVVNLARADAEMIFAGKSAGHHYKKQYETNILLAELAKMGKSVVRLKGGDPFVFGRGGEEAEVLKNENIEFEVVPAVSSCYSAPAYAGIPVTHRDYASSFSVITGHKKADSEEELDYKTIAKIDGTLVFLMSLSNLENIADNLILNGKDKKTPVAVIEKGTTFCQKTAVSDLENIAKKVKSENIQPPALTVVGDVVLLENKLDWFKKGLLSGKKIIATGTPMNVAKISDAFEKYKAQVCKISLIDTVYNENQKISQIDFSDYAWIVFTSANGVDMFFEKLGNEKVDIRNLMHLKFAVIGSGTEKELMMRGFKADCIPEKFESIYLAKELLKRLENNEKTLIIRAGNGSEILQRELAENKKEFTEFNLYYTKMLENRRELFEINSKDADYIIFSSGSAVKAFAKFNHDGINAKIVSIGSQTTKTAENLGIKVDITAKEATYDSIAKAVAEDYENGLS